MKVKFFILLITVTLLIPALSFGQYDSLKKELENRKNDYCDISNARMLLIEYLKKDNFEKVKEIKDYLLTEYGTDKYVFDFSEYSFLLFLTGEYDELLAAVDAPVPGILPENKQYFSWQMQLSGNSWGLNAELYTKIYKEYRTLLKQIDNAILKEQDKDFLKLLLKFIVSTKKNRLYSYDFQDTIAINQDTVNRLADNFLNKYPNNPYKTFVCDNIRLKYVLSDWKYTVSFFSGYGFFTNKIKTYVNNNVPVGVAFDVYYKKFVLYLRDYIGFSHLSKDIPYSLGVWEKGSSLQIIIPEASLGYIVKQTNHIKMAPFAGISYIFVSPSAKDIKNNQDLNNVEIGSSAFLVGLNLDIIPFGNGSGINTPFPSSDYAFIKIRYGYGITNFGKKYSGFDGNHHYFTLGIGIFTSRLKREKHCNQLK